MKRLLLYLLLAASCLEVHGQKIHFTDTSNSWNVHLTGGGTEYYSVVHTYKFSGDTLIGGNGYKIMTGSSQNRLVAPWLSYPPAPVRLFFREDTVAGKLWVRRKSDVVDSLVYDSSWTLGDTIRKRTLGTVIEKWFISGIDSTQMAGQWYKVFRVRSTMTNVGTPDYFAIIEGVGSTAWPDFIYSGAGGGESNFKLLCFNHQGATPVMSLELTTIYTHRSNGFSNAGPCDVLLVRLSAPDLARQKYEAILYPNPANRSSKIILPLPIQQGRLIIQNSSGQVVSYKVLSNTSAIPLPGDFNTPGLYFYRIIDEKDGKNFKGKFIYQ